MSAKKKQNEQKPVVVSATVNQPINESADLKPDFLEQMGGKAIYILLGLLVLLAFVVYRKYLLFENAFFFKDIGSDSYNYSYPATKGAAEYIAKYGKPSWSFHLGMGQSIYPFFLRDPFDILLYLGGTKNLIYLTGFKEFLKVVLSGLVFFQYLRTMRMAPLTAIVGSLFFAFCGFMVMGGGWYFFSFEAFNLALLLLAFERMLLRGKWLLFPFAIMLVSMSQPFNLYVYGLFLLGYAILRLYQEGYTLAKGGLFFAQMAGWGLLGVALSGVFMIENVVQLLESPRGSGNTSYTTLLSSQPVFNTVDKFQFGTAIMRFFSTDLLGAGTNFKGWMNTLEAPLFYCGLPCLLLMPQVFPTLDKRKRLFFILFIFIWFIPVIFPWFRWAFWLFSGDYYRAYSIVFSAFVMYYAIQAFDNILKTRKVNLPILGGTLGVLFLLLNYPYFSEVGDIVDSAVLTFVCFMLLVYAALLFAIGRNGTPAYLPYVFLLALCFEVVYLSGISVNDREPVTVEELNQRVGYNDFTTDALAYIEKNDRSFYRIDKSYASSPAMHYSLNDAQAQGYNSTSSYNPFNQLYFIRYLQLMGLSDKNNEQDSRWARGLSGRPILESANRVKYMLAKNDAVPIWRVTSDSIARFGDVTLWRNKFLLPFGFGYRYYIKESVFNTVGMTQRDFIALKACVVADEDVAKLNGLQEFKLQDTLNPAAFNLDVFKQHVDELAKDSLVISSMTQTEIKGKYNATASQLVYLSLPYDGGWTLKVDGKDTEKQILFAGMTGIFLTPGQHNIELQYGLRYFNSGLLLSVIGLLVTIALWFLMGRKKTNNTVSANA